MIVRNNVKWFEWQKTTIKGVIQYPNDIHVVKAKRQCGKSVMAESIILKFTIEKPNAFSLYISPTLKQARKVFKELFRALNKTSILSKANESLLEITLCNGGVIQFASAEQGDTALQGYTVTGILVIDEAAFIPDNIYFSLTPTTDANNAPTLIISTPQFRRGFFYDNFSDRTTEYIHSYDWCDYDTSALLSKNKLEFYRKKLPDIKFRQYYLGQFCDINTEGAFGDFTKVLSNTIAPVFVAKNRWDKPTPKDNYFNNMGIDWGSGSKQDETAISVFNNLKQQIYIEHFNDLNETQTLNRIEELIKRFKPQKIISENNSIGKIYNDLLEKIVSKYADTALVRFNTTNDSKNKIISKLQVAIQNGDIQLLDDNYQSEQFSQYVPQLTKTGKVTYNATSGYRDDLVMATAMCYNSLEYAKYTII